MQSSNAAHESTAIASGSDADNANEIVLLMPCAPLPAESRAFSIVELLVLVVGFSLAARVVSRDGDWHRATTQWIVAGLFLYCALGLSFCGPIMVSWRERLGQRRAQWGLGESLWFTTGLPTQAGVLTVCAADLFTMAVTPFVFIFLIVVLPMIYLTGNPHIHVRRAPLSWSNLVGVLSVLLWIATVFAYAMVQT